MVIQKSPYDDVVTADADGTSEPVNCRCVASGEFRLLAPIIAAALVAVEDIG